MPCTLNANPDNCKYLTNSFMKMKPSKGTAHPTHASDESQRVPFTEHYDIVQLFVTNSIFRENVGSLLKISKAKSHMISTRNCLRFKMNKFERYFVFYSDEHDQNSNGSEALRHGERKLHKMLSAIRTLVQTIALEDKHLHGVVTSVKTLSKPKEANLEMKTAVSTTSALMKRIDVSNHYL